MGNMTPTWGSTSQGPVQLPITLKDAQSELQLARAIGFLASGGSANGWFIPLVREAFEVQLKISECKKISPKIGLWHLLLSSTCLLATVEAAMIIFFYHLRIIYKLMIPKFTIFCLYGWEWLKIAGGPCLFLGLVSPNQLRWFTRVASSRPFKTWPILRVPHVWNLCCLRRSLSPDTKYHFLLVLFLLFLEFDTHYHNATWCNLRWIVVWFIDQSCL